MQTLTLHRQTRHHSRVFHQIARWRDNVLDLDVQVDDRRAEAIRAVAALHDAIAERDRAAKHLAHLNDWYNDAATQDTTCAEGVEP